MCACACLRKLKNKKNHIWLIRLLEKTNLVVTAKYLLSNKARFRFIVSLRKSVVKQYEYLNILSYLITWLVMTVMLLLPHRLKTGRYLLMNPVFVCNATLHTHATGQMLHVLYTVYLLHIVLLGLCRPWPAKCIIWYFLQLCLRMCVHVACTVSTLAPPLSSHLWPLGILYHHCLWNRWFVAQRVRE